MNGKTRSERQRARERERGDDLKRTGKANETANAKRKWRETVGGKRQKQQRDEEEEGGNGD